MSKVLDLVARVDHRPTFYWLILECGHWCKWLGRRQPKIGSMPSVGEDVPCPACRPEISRGHVSQA